MSGIAIGVDVGSLGLRVAWSTPDCQPVEVRDLVPAAATPWVTAEVGAGSISFVSARQQRSHAAVDLLVGELTTVRERVGTEVGEAVGRAVLTVPARMESRHRIALRDAARKAGFTDVHLINDAIAAVLGEEGSGPAQTMLVYSLGYSGFEAGLLRIARRQVRVLHHTASDTPSGVGLDTWVMNAWLESLGKRAVAGLGWTAVEWARLRGSAEEVKHRLAGNERVGCGWPPWDPEPTRTLDTPTPEEFQRFAGNVVAGTRDQLRGVLAEAGLTSEDVDTVLLVGGCTSLPAVSTMLQDELTGSLRRTGQHSLARGAAIYGARLRSTDTALDEDAQFIDVRGRPVEPSGLSLPRPAVSPEPVHTPDPVDDARRLWSDGKPEEAKTALTALIDRANQLLTEIDQAIPTPAADSKPNGPLPESAPEARARARRAIDRAASWLKKGRLVDAVSESHKAWHQAPDVKDIFEQMIAVHVGAATTAKLPDRFDEARQWLHCALTHSRFNNQGVVACLVDLLLSQVRYHREQGRLEEARSLLEECLEFSPDHSGVLELSAEIAG